MLNKWKIYEYVCMYLNDFDYMQYHQIPGVLRGEIVFVLLLKYKHCSPYIARTNVVLKLLPLTPVLEFSASQNWFKFLNYGTRRKSCVSVSSLLRCKGQNIGAKLIMQRLGNDRMGSSLTSYTIDREATLTHLKFRDIPIYFENCTSFGIVFPWLYLLCNVSFLLY